MLLLCCAWSFLEIHLFIRFYQICNIFQLIQVWWLKHRMDRCHARRMKKRKSVVMVLSVTLRRRKSGTLGRRRSSAATKITLHSYPWELLKKTTYKNQYIFISWCTCTCVLNSKMPFSILLQHLWVARLLASPFVNIVCTVHVLPTHSSKHTGPESFDAIYKCFQILSLVLVSQVILQKAPHVLSGVKVKVLHHLMELANKKFHV